MRGANWKHIVTNMVVEFQPLRHPDSISHRCGLNDLDITILGTDIDFCVQTLPDLQHPSREYPSIRQRVITQLRCLAPSIVADAVEDDDPLGV
jgi:hypothetical protein